MMTLNLNNFKKFNKAPKAPFFFAKKCGFKKMSKFNSNDFYSEYDIE